MSDQTLTCRDCGTQFTFTEGEQAFYQERGFSPPTRCPSCRARRKAERNANAGSYGSGGYGGDSYGNGESFSGGGQGGGYSSGPRQLYPAICSNCGRETEVPFQPRNDKPVYCRECFQAMRSSQTRYSDY
ncbi:MAG: CxxC-x17-CxxC domain-containing protein [Thermomicrobiales bacterium]